MMRRHALLPALLLTATTLARAADVTVDVRHFDSQAPAANVKITWAASDNVKGAGETDTAGRYTIPSLPDSTMWLVARATADGMVPLVTYWNQSPTNSTPPRILFLVEKSTRISGHVVDEAGRPIPGATVAIQVGKKYPGSEQHIDLNWHTTKTDADGLFFFTGVPANPDQVKLGTYDLGHLLSDYYDTAPYSPLKALWDGAAKLTLPAGTPVDITILKPDGSAAAGAKVFVGRNNHVVNCYAPTTADARGVVHLGGRPGFSTTVTASLDGFGPAQSALAITSAPQQVTLKLTPPSPRAIDVVDTAGRPIAGAEIRPTTWGRNEVFSDEVKTDAAGHATWNAGPADPVLTRIDANGYMGRRDFPWSPNAAARVVLARPTPVAATVVDAKTNQPIPEFSIRPAVVWNEGERSIWQNNGWLDGETRKSPGRFELKLAYPAARYTLRVSADGHLPEDIGPIDPDGTPRKFDVRLQPAASVAGRVLGVDDRPIAGADVYLVTASDWMGLYNSRPQSENSGIHTTTDAAGHFSLPPQKEDFALLVLSDRGTITLKRQDLTPDIAIHLPPYAAVHGTVRIQGQPATAGAIYGHADSTTLADDKPVIARQYAFGTNKDGTFTLPNVPAGRLLLQRQVPNHAPGRIWHVTLASLDLKPGQDAEFHIGQGASVTGQLLIPAGKRWMIRRSHLEPKGKPHQPGFENVEILDDGRFRADGLAPGDYTLHVALHDFPPNESCGWGRVVGEYDRDVTIPPAAANKATDVGTVAPNPATDPDLKAGDPAPDFAVKTFDGRTLRLSDLKGKVILLDYWATWCAPCIAELPNLKKLHAAHASDPNFVMLSLSIDDSETDPRRFVTGEGFAWPQAWLGVDAPTVHAYGATAVPATFLLGPDGRIVARDLRGDALRSAVDAALAPAVSR